MSFGEGLQQGNDVAQSVQDNWRKNAAMNALAKAYGPIAADPAAEQAAVNAQVDPLKVQQAQRENTANNALVQQYGPTAGDPTSASAMQETQQKQADAQRMAGYRATSILQSYADPKTGAVSPQVFDQVVGDGSLLGIDPQHLAPLRQLVTAPGGASHLGAIAQSLIGPTKVAGTSTVIQNPDGSYGVAREDQYGNMHTEPLGGATPVVANATQQRAAQGAQRVQQGQERVGIAQQNANTGAYRADVTSNNSLYGASGNVPAPQTGGASSAPNPQAIDRFIQQNGGIDGAIAATAKMPKNQGDNLARVLTDRYEQTQRLGPQGAPAPTSAIDRLPPKGRQMAIGQAQHLADQGTNLQNTNAILAQVQQQIAPYTAGAGSSLAALPGTVQRNLRANLETLSAQGLTSWIQSLKNTQGNTGIGRVLQSEANAAMKLYGNMEQAQSAQQLAYHTKLFGYAVNQLYAHARAGFQQQWKTDPESALGTSAPTAGNSNGPADYSHLWK